MPSLLLALMCAFIRAPRRLAVPHAERPRGDLMTPTFVMCLIGGVLVTFASSGLLFWARWLIIDERGFSAAVPSFFFNSSACSDGVKPKRPRGGAAAGKLVGLAKDARGRCAKPRKIIKARKQRLRALSNERGFVIRSRSAGR